ncbi:acyl-CoA thioesterase [Aquihabitans sp. McL0605]|uniref:acyl-CoA thioesterase n=1 Tax=Aquihabitans sp. McL0605 TaxID=3415671 RepID=UPI003CECF432
MSPFDESISLQPGEPGTWFAFADPHQESISAMFGGWSSAVSLHAVQCAAEAEGEPLDPTTPAALTINFIERVTPGHDVRLHVQHLGGGRSLAHWRADIHSLDDDRMLTTATVVLANRRATDGHVEPAVPAVPEPDGLDEYRAPGPQGQRTVLRPISGFPPEAQADTTSRHWLRELSGRPVDHLLLAYLADQYPPRSFYWGAGPRPSASVTLSVYFHATVAELDAVGDDHVLVDAVGTRGAESTSGQQARIWSRGGVLLATTEQLAWYR